MIRSDRNEHVNIHNYVAMAIPIPIHNELLLLTISWQNND